jgi:C-terminal processing protease CtpA/Prc
MTVIRFRIFLLFLIWIYLYPVGSAGAVVELNAISDGTIRLEARDSNLGEIVSKFYDRYTLEIKGLENRESEKVTFSYTADTLEDLLKSLLRHLGIKNYAFEFDDEILKRLVAVPETTTDVSSLSPSSNIPKQENEFVSIAQVQSIIEASQAESAGLQIGDIILEYDGVPINSAQQLVREVEKKAQVNQIEMVIVRQKIPTRLILNGGFIGVRILTKKIPRAEFNAFQ